MSINYCIDCGHAWHFHCDDGCDLCPCLNEQPAAAPVPEPVSLPRYSADIEKPVEPAPAAVPHHTCMGGDPGSGLNGPCRACEIEQATYKPPAAAPAAEAPLLSKALKLVELDHPNVYERIHLPEARQIVALIETNADLHVAKSHA